MVIYNSHWDDLGNHLQETMFYPVKYGMLPNIFWDMGQDWRATKTKDAGGIVSCR